MRLRHVLAAAAALAPLSLPALAQPLSLPDAVSAALTHDPSIEIGQAGVDQADAALRAARAARGGPAGVQASVGVSETTFPDGTSFLPVDRVSLTPATAGVEAKITLFSSGALGAAVDQSKKARDAARFSSQDMREGAILDTLTAYADQWLAERSTNVRQQQFETLQLRRRETGARYDQGLITVTDVALADARLAGSEAEFEASRASVLAAQAHLERLTGVAEPEVQDLSEVILVLPPSQADALDSALRNSSTAAAARASAESASAGVAAAKGQFGPKVELSAKATAGKDTSFIFTDPMEDAGAYLNFSMPLYTSGQRGASVGQAVAARTAANARARQAELFVRQNVQALWGDIAARELALKAAIRGEEAAIKVAEGARREHEGGLRTLVDALDAEDDRRNAEIARLSAERALFLSKATLLVLTGDIESQAAGPQVSTQ